MDGQHEQPAGVKPEVPPQPEQPQQQPVISEEAVLARWRQLLEGADLETTSEKQLRIQLAGEFSGLDLDSKTDEAKAWKAKLRAETEAYLERNQPADENAEEEAAADDEEDAKPAAKKRGGGGLSKPCVLSPPLAAFLGVEQMGRPQIVKTIWAYIKENNLQDPKNKQKIMCDEKMLTIFKPPITMFSMNKQLSKHVKRADEVGSRHDDDDDDDEAPKPRRSAKKAAPAKKKAKKEPRSDGEEDEEESEEDAGDSDEDFKPKRKGKGGGGYTAPVKVSHELAEFLGVPEMSRAQITSFMHKYFKEHQLQDPKDRRYIICDEALGKITSEKRFLAFGVQRIVAPHILKKE